MVIASGHKMVFWGDLMSGNEVKVKKQKRLRTANQLSALIRNYYADLAGAKENGRPVAWVTAVTPVEILYAMDILPFLPENYAAACASSQISQELCSAAEGLNYSMDVCSYARTVIGSQAMAKTPLNLPLPRPDLLIATTLACDAHIKWFEALSRQWECPLFVIDGGYTIGRMPTEYQKKYFVNELKRLVDQLEKLTGRCLDMDRFREAVQYSSEASELWHRILALRTKRPSPLKAIEVFTNMFPTVTLSGSPAAVAFFQELYNEIKELTERGVGAVKEEKFRVGWELFPFWYNLRFWDYLEENGVAVVVDRYGDSFSMHMDGGDPFLAMVQKYLDKTQANYSIQDRINTFKKYAVDYQVDGFIFHLNRSCRFHSPAQLELMKALKDEASLPCMMIESDMNDPRFFAQEQVKVRVDTFLETLKNRRNS